MIQIRQDMAAEEQRARALGLTLTSLAFYDAVAVNFFGCTMKRSCATHPRRGSHRQEQPQGGLDEPHREDVKATVRAAVRRELRRRDVRQEDLEPFMGYVLQQAEALYATGRWGICERP